MNNLVVKCHTLKYPVPTYIHTASELLTKSYFTAQKQTLKTCNSP